MPAGNLTVVMTRRALHELLGRVPSQRLAPLLGVSDSGLGKVCFRYEVNRSSRGDWARRLYRHHVARPRFRPALPGESEIDEFRSGEGGPRRFDRQLCAMLARDAVAPRVEIPDDLRRAHPLVRRGSSAAERRPYLGNENPPRPAAEYVISVSKSQHGDALCILSAFFSALDARRIGIRLLPWRGSSTLRLSVLGVAFGLRLTGVGTRPGATSSVRRRRGSATDTGINGSLTLHVHALRTRCGGRWTFSSMSTAARVINDAPSALIAIATAVRASSSAPARGGPSAMRLDGWPVSAPSQLVPPRLPRRSPGR